MMILVVEDDTWQADHYARELGRAGYEVRTARHAYDAMAQIDEMIPDAIVLDMMLPGSNGLALLHELRSHDDLAAVPVVMASSLTLAEDTLRPYGVCGVIDKTTATNEDLVIALRKVLA